MTPTPSSRPASFKELLGRLDLENNFVSTSEFADALEDFSGRVTPATMKLVLKALELTEQMSPDMPSQREAAVAAMTALDHLNSIVK